MSFKEIVLAIDRTQDADLVFDQGISVANHYNACLTLVHCIHESSAFMAAATVPPAGVGIPWPETTLPPTGSPLMAGFPAEATALDRQDNLYSVVQDWLKQYVQKAYDAGREDVTHEIRSGQPGDCICELATEMGADLIVVGRKGRSGLEEMLLGSVSNHVVHHAPCSVLVVQPQGNG